MSEKILMSFSVTQQTVGTLLQRKPCPILLWTGIEWSLYCLLVSSGRINYNIYFNYHSDEDECLNNSHSCSENATCTNTEGSFNCSCKPGYIGNGHNCSGWFLEFLSRFPLVSFETSGSAQKGLMFSDVLLLFIVLFAISCRKQKKSNYLNSHGEEAQKKPPGL